MSAHLVGMLAFGLAGALLAGFLAIWRRLGREKRRADAADSLARTYLSVIEILAGVLKREGRTGPAEKLALEMANRLGVVSDEPEAPGPGKKPDVVTPGPPLPGLPPSPRDVSESRYLFVSFEQEIRRAEAQSRPLTLVTLEAGPATAAKSASEPAVSDRILRGVAHAVRGQMRGCDTCIRYAAREFILILPGVSREEARRVEARIRTAILAVAVEPRPGTEVRAHPILGSATYPDDGSTFDQLLTIADGRRSQDDAPDFPGGPPNRLSRALPWRQRPGSPN